VSKLSTQFDFNMRWGGSPVTVLRRSLVFMVFLIFADALFALHHQPPALLRTSAVPMPPCIRPSLGLFGSMQAFRLQKSRMPFIESKFFDFRLLRKASCNITIESKSRRSRVLNEYIDMWTPLRSQEPGRWPAGSECGL
jgi:hypothetical protein